MATCVDCGFELVSPTALRCRACYTEWQRAVAGAGHVPELDDPDWHPDPALVAQGGIWAMCQRLYDEYTWERHAITLWRWCQEKKKARVEV